MPAVMPVAGTPLRSAAGAVPAGAAAATATLATAVGAAGATAAVAVADEERRGMPACAAAGGRATNSLMVFLGHSGSTATMTALQPHSQVHITGYGGKGAVARMRVGGGSR